MTKSFLRVVALLIIPALIADPLLAQGYGVPDTRRPMAGVFAQEALAAAPLAAHRAVLHSVMTFFSVRRLFKAALPFVTAASAFGMKFSGDGVDMEQHPSLWGLTQAINQTAQKAVQSGHIAHQVTMDQVWGNLSEHNPQLAHRAVGVFYKNDHLSLDGLTGYVKTMAGMHFNGNGTLLHRWLHQELIPKGVPSQGPSELTRISDQWLLNGSLPGAAKPSFVPHALPSYFHLSPEMIVLGLASLVVFSAAVWLMSKYFKQLKNSALWKQVAVAGVFLLVGTTILALVKKGFLTVAGVVGSLTLLSASMRLMSGAKPPSVLSRAKVRAVNPAPKEFPIVTVVLIAAISMAELGVILSLAIPHMPFVHGVLEDFAAHPWIFLAGASAFLGFSFYWVSSLVVPAKSEQSNPRPMLVNRNKNTLLEMPKPGVIKRVIGMIILPTWPGPFRGIRHILLRLGYRLFYKVAMDVFFYKLRMLDAHISDAPSEVILKLKDKWEVLDKYNKKWEFTKDNRILLMNFHGVWNRWVARRNFLVRRSRLFNQASA